MKVKLLVPICGPDGSFKAGDKPDLPEALAKALVKDGHAKTLEVVKTAELKADSLANAADEGIKLKHCKKCDFTCDNQSLLLKHYKEQHPKGG